MKEISPSDVALMLRAHRAHGKNVAERKTAIPRVSLRKYKTTTMAYRRWIGRKVDEWLQTEAGRAAKALRCYWSMVAPLLGWAHEHAPPTAMRRFWQRCLKDFRVTGSVFAGRPVAGTGFASARGKNVRRCRATGRQGRPKNSEELWYALYHWFIDHRRFIRGRTGPKQLRPIAIALQEAISRSLLQQGLMPNPINLLSPRFWYEWRLWARVSWKHPTRKFKTTLKKYLARTRVYFYGLFLIRWFMVLAFGRDPLHEHSDQKGLQVNTATSKNAPTLELDGIPEVTIKDNAMQSRERMSICTTTMNFRPADAPDQHERRVPLEMMGRWSDATVANMILPPGGRYTVQNSPKGSYRLPHMEEFSRRHLARWTEARAEAHDIRIWGIDAFQVHNMRKMLHLPWEYGYFRWGPPGSTTDSWAIPDTDVHATVDRDFMDWNTASAVRQLRERPHKLPCETPQSCCSACVGIWEKFPHDDMVEAYRRRGLSNKLDGSEDWRMARRQASLFFNEKVNGPDLRRKAKFTVETFLRQFRPDQYTYDMLFQLVGLHMYDNDPECDGTFV
jgi:hypothetical protein